MAILICFASCDNGSTSGGGTQKSSIDYTLGDAPSENLILGKENFSVEENPDGIYIKFAIPKKAVAYKIYIDGVGLVTENYSIKDLPEDNFFYPFLDPNEEYAVRVVFLEEEKPDNEGFIIGYQSGGDGVVGWFDVNAKAGENSKGLVRLKDFGEIKVENNGDFKYTKKTAFDDKNCPTWNDYDWVVNTAVVEGVSWMHEGRKTKWLGEIYIPHETLAQTRNLYTTKYYWRSGEALKIDFICYRPMMSYTDKEGNPYTYQWAGSTVDTPQLKSEEEMFTDIDITKSADVAKIQGTWTIKDEEWDDTKNNVHIVFYVTLIINNNNVKNFESCIYTKLDGGIFTETEAKDLVDGDNSYELSEDSKTIIEKFDEYEESLSEYFADRKYDDGSTRHYDLKLFKDGTSLRIIRSGKNEDGKDYSYFSDFKKQ